jgi:serine/threonine protein phosphatase PrpC
MPNDGLSYASGVDIGRRKRLAGGINEDSLTVQRLDDWHRSDDRHGLVFALADGAGGPDTGDVASYIATTTAVTELAPVLARAHAARPETVGVDAPPLDSDGSVVSDPLDGAAARAAIEDAVRAAHRRILEYVHEAPVERSATTVVVGLYDGQQLHYGWVGDSRLYVLDEAAGTIRLLSEDHSETRTKVDDGEVDPVAARVHPSTRIDRYLGGDKYASDDVEVETGTIDVHRDDVIFATSDGLVDAYVADDDEPTTSQLYDQYRDADDEAAARQRILDAVVTHDEMRETILDAPTLDDAASSLIDLANDRGGKDNLSVFLLADDTATQTPDSVPNRGTALPDADAGHATGSSDGAGESTDSDPDRVVESADDDSDSVVASTDSDPDSNGELSHDVSESPDDAQPHRGLLNCTTGRDFIVKPGDVIGRDETADIGVPHDLASREHCVFLFEDGTWFLEDRSSNGTLVKRGDDHVHVTDERAPIRGGDVIVIPAVSDDEAGHTGVRRFEVLQ